MSTQSVHASSKYYIPFHVNNICKNITYAYTHACMHTHMMSGLERKRERRRETEQSSDVFTYCTTDCDYTTTHNLNTMHFSFAQFEFFIFIFHYRKLVQWCDSIDSKHSKLNTMENMSKTNWKNSKKIWKRKELNAHLLCANLFVHW